MMVVPGYVVEYTLFESVTSNKVKLELMNAKDGIEGIALPETIRVKGVWMDSSVCRTDKGKVEVMLISASNKNTTLKQKVYSILIKNCK